LQRRHPPRWDSPHPATQVLKTGQPMVFPDVSDEVLRRMSEGDEHRRLAQALGAKSGLCVPLESRGRVLGALTAGSAQADHRYRPADVEVILEIARRAAVAIDNA